jgi:intraflagellar transport protein 74
MKEEAAQLDADLEESQSERSHKYRELRKREETMDQFLETFESSKQEEVRRLASLEAQNVAMLEKISRALSLVDRLPNPKDYGEMRDELSFKEGELRKSRSTVEGLAQEKAQLQANLEKIEALEEKVTTTCFFSSFARIPLDYKFTDCVWPFCDDCEANFSHQLCSSLKGRFKST